MDLYTITAILVFLAAIFGYINARFLKFPTTIGLMFVTIALTLVAFIISYFDDSILKAEYELIRQIDFNEVLMDYMLSFLLFAGALHTDTESLKRYQKPIAIFATLGVLVSTFLVGTMMYYVLLLLQFPVDYVYCLLFGSLISPTDPIAVLGILKKSKVPKKLEIKVVGESLLNDGIGVVIFLTLFEIASLGRDSVTALGIGELFALEVFGGVLLGGLIGWLTFKLLKSIDDFTIEVIITLATVMIGTVVAKQFHMSAPLAMVAAGLVIGNDRSRKASMSKTTELYLDKFWELIDILLNSVLFVLIGLEILVLSFDKINIITGILAIPIVLICRYLSLWLPIKLYEKKLEFVPKTNLVMTWGGLRGGISIALALSLSADMNKDMFLIVTYMVVAFSILVQGLTIKKLIQKIM